jgi:hypothetical protein
MFNKLLSKFFKPSNQLKIIFSTSREREKATVFINGLHFSLLLLVYSLIQSIPTQGKNRSIYTTKT